MKSLSATFSPALRRLAAPVLAALIGAGLGACHSVSATKSGRAGVEPTQSIPVVVGRSQLEQEAEIIYRDALKEAEKQGTLNASRARTERVRRVVNRVIAKVGVLRPDAAAWTWEVNVLEGANINAFCLPGGKVIFYSGLIDKLNLTDEEIAYMAGHEIAHALREHPIQRGAAPEVGVGSKDSAEAQAIKPFGKLGLAVPYKGRMEDEADGIGMELAARAGFHPRGAASALRKMEAKGIPAHEWINIHADFARHLAEMETISARVMPLYLATLPKPKAKDAEVVKLDPAAPNATAINIPPKELGRIIKTLPPATPTGPIN